MPASTTRTPPATTALLCPTEQSSLLGVRQSYTDAEETATGGLNNSSHDTNGSSVSSSENSVMSFPGKQIKWLYHEFGLSSLWATGWNAWLIILTRCLRMFAYGTNALIIALFFNTLNFSDSHIGLFMTLTLLGDVALSFFLTLIADKIGRRMVLFGGAALMALSGAVFALFDNFWILLFAAVVGVISPTGSEIGPFRAVEESTISHLTNPKTRSDVLAWYVTTATLGSAIGSQVCGRIVDLLSSKEGWELKDAYHAVFWVYTAMGLLNMGLVLLLSRDCEAEPAPPEQTYQLLDESDEEDISEPSTPSSISKPQKQAPIQPVPKKRGIFATISPSSRSVMYRLCTLFALDSLGGGMTPWSWINYFLSTKFSPISSSTLGSISSTAFTLSAISTLFAAPLARRLGLINTMVFTHFPSSIALAALPAPSTLPPTIALLLFRSALSSMDQAPRAAFVAAVVKPEERTAVMGFNSMLRTLAQSSGPSVTGILAGNDKFWVAFLAAGALKASYDVGLWIWGLSVKLDGEKKAPARQDEENGGSR
jgi:MFS family permease